MKYLETFAGIGGFRLGINQAYENYIRSLQQKMGGDSGNIEDRCGKFTRFRCIGYSEFDPSCDRSDPKCKGYHTAISEFRSKCGICGKIKQQYAPQIYQKQFPNTKAYGDITKIDPKELPDFDLLVGGFPCQAFSIAGKRRGFDDTRGTLFFEIARIIKQKQPRYLLLENVKGLLSHDKGNTFATILSALDELGYSVEWQVLNSKNFGVPQNRERVFIIGHLGGFRGRQIFPLGHPDKEDTRNVGEDLSYTIDANYHKGTNTLEKGRRQLIQLNNPKHSNDRVYSDGGISPTLNTAQGGNRQPFVQQQPLKFLKRNQKNIEGDYSFTVDSMNTGGVKVDSRIRRLTPIECERLQGFPDRWTAYGVNEGLEGKNTAKESQKDGVTAISDTQRYKCLGNAVTVNVVQTIMEKLLVNLK